MIVTAVVSFLDRFEVAPFFLSLLHLIVIANTRFAPAPFLATSCELPRRPSLCWGLSSHQSGWVPANANSYRNRDSCRRARECVSPLSKPAISHSHACGGRGDHCRLCNFSAVMQFVLTAFPGALVFFRWRKKKGRRRSVVGLGIGKIADLDLSRCLSRRAAGARATVRAGRRGMPVEGLHETPWGVSQKMSQAGAKTSPCARRRGFRSALGSHRDEVMIRRHKGAVTRPPRYLFSLLFNCRLGF